MEKIAATGFSMITPVIIDEPEKRGSGLRESVYLPYVGLCNAALRYHGDSLNRLVEEGNTCYIGISNCNAWQLAKANTLKKREGFVGFVSV